MAKLVGITYRLEEKLVPYAKAVRAVGLEPVPLLPPGPVSLEGLDGLLISGGTDLNPALYGQRRHRESDEPDDERDRMELALAREALEAGLPLLCICRGMQLLNVALGGDLIQHLDRPGMHRVPGVDDAHPVTPEPDTALARITGAASYTVNSRHHQAVQRAGKDLVISARSPDGIAEALEIPGLRFVVAVQWHPEDRVPSHVPDTRLFEAFAQAL
ncbi:MAG: gamma-glutamyl-gamma-aminobutyrate hydrolase family protein [Bryobacterales bacterium]|nr:gamma-glutamyl-gamma-aminobutyrate hydrolase family protein [Bryobacterales bacterium]